MLLEPINLSYKKKQQQTTRKKNKQQHSLSTHNAKKSNTYYCIYCNKASHSKRIEPAISFHLSLKEKERKKAKGRVFFFVKEVFL